MPQPNLTEWLEKSREPLLPTWQELPSIPLYMDQVLLYLGEVLAFFETDGMPLLTSSMVNNYVKAGVLPHPEKKKYSRAHLGALLMICMLKPVLSLKEIARLLGDAPMTEPVYEQFRAEQETAVRAVCAVVDQQLPATDRQQLALRRALAANAERTAAQKLLQEAKTEPEQP